MKLEENSKDIKIVCLKDYKGEFPVLCKGKKSGNIYLVTKFMSDDRCNCICLNNKGHSGEVLSGMVDVLPPTTSITLKND
jgi:hypothetical protein